MNGSHELDPSRLAPQDKEEVVFSLPLSPLTLRSGGPLGPPLPRLGRSEAGVLSGWGAPAGGLRSLALLQAEHHGRRLSELHEVPDVRF